MVRPIGICQANVQDVTHPMRNTSLDKPQRALVSGIRYSRTSESRIELLLALPHGANY